MDHHPDTKIALQASPSMTSPDNLDLSDKSSATKVAKDTHPSTVDTNSATENAIDAHMTPLAAIADGLEADIRM